MEMAFPDLTLAETALVVVDMQNDFVLEGAPLEVAEARETMPAIRRLIDQFRAHRRPVIYTRFIAGPKRTLIWTWGQADCHAAPTCCCWRHHRRRYADGRERLCADVIDELAPEPVDYIVDKYGYDAFHNTQLPDILQAEGCTGIVVTGTVTQICVDTTIRGAMHHGFRCLVVSDAVSSFRQDLHEAALAVHHHKFGWVAPSDEVLAAFAPPG